MMTTTSRNQGSTANLRVPPPTVGISRRETIEFPLQLDPGSSGIIGFSRTTHSELVTVRCIWSGRLTDLSDDQYRVERELTQHGFELGARIGDATIYPMKARLVDADGQNVAPMFIPRWTADVRMSGQSLVSVGADKAIRFGVDSSPSTVPAELLDRVTASYTGRSPWIVTASSLLTLHVQDAERIARSPRPALQLELVVRAVAVPEL